MRNRITLLGLLVVFIILAALTALTGQQEPTPPDVPATAEAELTPEATFEMGSLLRIFPDLRVLDIQAIRLEDLSSGEQLTLVRAEDGRWTAPDLEGELDETAARNIARTLVLLPYARSINILPDTEFETYDLAPTPRLMFQILKVDGSSHVIAIGGLLDSGAAYYTLVDERDEIFETERGPVDFLKNQIGTPPIRLTN
jgi:hypothetical protein